MEVNVDYVIRALRSSDRLKSFKTGHEAFKPLKAFLVNQAWDFDSSSVAKTYVAVKVQKSPNGEPCIAQDGSFEEARDTCVLAFITVTCSEIDIRNGYELDDCPFANRYSSLPALKIARLAVDARYRGQGIGDELVALSLALASDVIAPAVGCRFVVTDAKPEAVGFYKKVGFTQLDTDENNQAETPVMFVDLIDLDQYVDEPVAAENEIPDDALAAS